MNFCSRLTKFTPNIWNFRSLDPPQSQSDALIIWFPISHIKNITHYSVLNEGTANQKHQIGPIGEPMQLFDKVLLNLE